MLEKIIFAWSGGKDSAMALYELQQAHNYEILALLTTITQGYDRVSMHGVRATLLQQQAESLDLALEKIYITKDAVNEEYEAKMKERLMHYKNQGVFAVAFGDIFLEDLKKYREDNLSRIGMKGIFPIWKRDTAELANAFIGSGFKAIITCVDTKFLGKDFVGRQFDKQFLRDIPCGVDHCGENGEFHSFVYDGPVFRKKIPYEKGETVLREDRFYYCDLRPITT